MAFDVECLGGSLDGTFLDVSDEELIEKKILMVTYSVGNELYGARKYKGKMVLFYIGKKKGK